MNCRRLSIKGAFVTLVTGVALVAGLVSVAPAAGAATVSSVPGAPQTGRYAPLAADNAPIELAVVLTPSSRSKLRSLAAQKGSGSQQQRAAAVARTAPTSAARNQTRQALIGSGLRIVKESSWAIWVSATPATAEKVFAVHLIGSGASRHPDREPTIPSSIARNVTTVLGLDQRPVMHRRAVPPPLTPTDLKSLYNVNPPLSTAGTGATVATLQFSGWHSSDLTTYASFFSLAVPPLAQISVDGADPAVPDGNGGDGEVALDQEMILAGAPKANQRAYFAPNTVLGGFDLYAAAADDVGAFNITAISTSWGFCELGASPSYRNAVQDAISRAVASGATTFAAVGDTGSNDCNVAPTDPANPDVDFPAALPEVVGVGGTAVDLTGSTWSETAWNDSDGATGGGESQLYARPSYQTVTVPGTTNRLVPDISAVAAPSTGPAGYIAGHWTRVGGTSASAPLMAGQLAATLSDRGCPVGIGDIHSVLYTNPTDFNDITVGNNGAYSTRTGYDAVTGLGTPKWNAIGPHLVPTASACPLMIRTSYLSPPSGGDYNDNHTTATIPYSRQLVASGGTAPYTWSFLSGMPPVGELTLNASTGVLSGTPTTPATYTFTIQVADNASHTASRQYTLIVDPLAGRFVPVATTRVFDGQVGTGQRPVRLAGVGPVPSGATAAVVNVEVFNPSSAGYVRVTPYSQDAGVATQEFVRGQTISNLVVVKLVSDYAQVKVSAGSARILMDVAGYFVDKPGSVFTPVTTSRIFDRTVGTTNVAVPLPPGIASQASAAVMNVEVYNPSVVGYVRVTPYTQDAGVATQEFVRGQTISNLVVVKVVGGQAQVKVNSGSARILIDLAGYYAADPHAGSAFVPVATTRIFDQTVPTTPQWIDVFGVGAVPAGATAVVMNLEVFNPSTGGYVRVTPMGQDAAVANQEFNAGQTISNLVVVKLNSGIAQVKVNAGSARILIDIAGYYR